MKLGLLPVIHLWLVLPGRNELVDFSTKWLPDQATKDGLMWRTDPPLGLLCCGPSEIPDGVLHESNVDAIRFALDFIRACR